MKATKPKLILVGAGPGDEELITLKGIKALSDADVILYDALANPALLKYARHNAKKIFVGKRAGLHHYQQFEINRLIVKYALEYGTVVRLKGGDPYVFGRGHEEMEYAVKHGVEVDVVPGISSTVAVPAMQNIPLTKRGICQSFTVVTATDKHGKLCNDIQWAATGKSTVVILMGMKKIESILSLFSQFRGKEEPIAIIQNGTKENEQRVMGTIGDIHQKIKEEGISSPAIIIIGEVVNQRLSTIMNNPQFNKNLEDSLFI